MKKGDVQQIAPDGRWNGVIEYPPAIFVEYVQFCMLSTDTTRDFWWYDMVRWSRWYHIGHIEWERDSFNMPVLELPE